MKRGRDLHLQGVAWPSGSQVISRRIEPIEVRCEARSGLGNEVEELIALSLGIAIGEMECCGVRHRHRLHQRRSVASGSFVALQSIDNWLVTREASPQHIGVFDRLARSLRQERDHRVTGIAEERDPTLAPSRQRLAVMERPPEHGIFDMTQETTHHW